MSALDLVTEEVQSRFGLSERKVSSLLSGLLSFITQQIGGVSGFVAIQSAEALAWQDCGECRRLLPEYLGL